MSTGPGVGPRPTAADGATPPPPPTGSRRPVGAVVSSVVDGVRSLIRKEVELVRIEMTEAAAVRARGVAMMAAAAVFGLFALGFIAAGGSAALDLVLPRWAAHLIVAGVFVVIALIAFLVGRGAMKNAPTPRRTQETLKEDARWAKQQIGR